MKTREQNLRYLIGQLVKCGATANTYGREHVDRMRIRCDGADTADDSSLRGDLPAGVGENKSLRWCARHLGGESCEDIAQETYDNADTIEDTVHLVMAYVEQEATGIDQ